MVDPLPRVVKHIGIIICLQLVEHLCNGRAGNHGQCGSEVGGYNGSTRLRRSAVALDGVTRRALCQLLVPLVLLSPNLDHPTNASDSVVVPAHVIELCSPDSTDAAGGKVLVSLACVCACNDPDILEQRRIETESNLYAQLLYEVAEDKAGAGTATSDTEEDAREGRHSRLGWRGPRLYDEHRADGDLIRRATMKERGKAIIWVKLRTELVVDVVHDAAGDSFGAGRRSERGRDDGGCSSV